MTALKPQVAAKIANEVYQAQSPITLELFLENPVFSQKRGDTKHLEAEVGLRIINVKDGFGVCAKGGKGYENDLFLVFRGTTSKNFGADFFTDARFGVENSVLGRPVHIGFNHAFISMLPAMRQFITRNISAGGTIHVVGHSLGGAVATLTADWLAQKGKKVKLYTFGSPKVGLEFFANQLTKSLRNENIFRVYHRTDVVPMVPVFPFAHAPTTSLSYQLPSDYLVSFAAHKMTNYIESVKEPATWETLKKVSADTIYAHSIEYWLKSDKPINPADPKTWDWINAGLTWVLRKVIGASAALIQAPIMIAFSIADKIAWMLRKGLDLAGDVAGWVIRIMRKIMQALGMKLAQTSEELTRHFMRFILMRLIQRMNDQARQSVMKLMS